MQLWMWCDGLKGLKIQKFLGLKLKKQNYLCQEIQFLNVCNYHSIPFPDDCIILDISEFIIVPQSNANFVSGEIIQNQSSQEMKILLYLIRNQRDQKKYIFFILLSRKWM